MFSKAKTTAAMAAVIGTMMAGSFAFAEGPRGGRNDDRPFPGPRMVEELKLTDKQVSEIKAIHEKNQESRTQQKEKVRELRNALREAMKSDASDSDLKKKFETLQAERQSMTNQHFDEVLKIRSVLTPEQRKKFQDMKGKRDGFGKWKDRKNSGRDRKGPPSEDDDSDF